MKLIREFRRTLVITVNEKGEVIVKAPYFLSLKKVNEFVDKKQNWIAKQQQKITQKELTLSNFDFKNYVYINGEQLDWKEIKKETNQTKSRFYSKQFYDKTLKKAVKIAESANLNPIFKLCNSKCIWGSCNSKNIIKINWKTLILSDELQDYIICHELAHLKQMNHSKEFWAEVQKLDPCYKEHRKKLKSFSFLLRTNVLEE